MFNDSSIYGMTRNPTLPWLAMVGSGEPPSAQKPQSCYDYPRPAYTADIVVFNTDKVLLIKRGKDPFKGKLALPGGFVNPGETSYEAARRELLEETGLTIYSSPRLVGIYDKPGRDPRGWIVSAAYVCRTSQTHVKAGDDAADAVWVSINSLYRDMLAFDHHRIINDAWDLELN